MSDSDPIEPDSIVGGATAELISVAIIDDHTMVAEGLASLVDQQPDLRVVGTGANVAEALTLVRDHHPDVVIIDYRLPDGDGASATVEILRAHEHAHVIMFSSLGSDELLARAVEAGCAGFLTKDRSGAEVLAAIRAASRDESLIPTLELKRLLERLSRPARPGPGELSARELEVLKLIAGGMSTEGVSERLYLSQHTVRNHVRNILSKLGAHSKLEAVAVAARDGLISLGEPTKYAEDPLWSPGQ